MPRGSGAARQAAVSPAGGERDRPQVGQVLPVVPHPGVARAVEVHEPERGEERAHEKQEGRERAPAPAPHGPEGRAGREDAEREEPLPPAEGSTVHRG
jgi:hypothetical protein